MEKKYTLSYIRELAHKRLNGQLTEQERADFEDWYNSHDDAEVILSEEYDSEEIIKARTYQVLAGQMSGDFTLKSNRRSRLSFAVAGSLFLLLAAVAYLYTQTSQPATSSVPAVTSNFEIAPGGNSAVLTLANGKKINLNNIKSGTSLSVASNIKVSKTAEGKIVYQFINDQTGVANTRNINTIATPAGGQYQVVLPDGSSVMLNASSSLSFPEQFAASERSVSLSGEGYFEINKDQKRPFKVKTRQQEVTVLGTHFNINSYNDEPYLTTTLAEGSVKVTAGDQVQVIKPGEQTKLSANNQKLLVTTANLEEDLAWKNGKMIFEDADLQAVLRQVSRWYNVGIRYDGQVHIKGINGKISRTESLNTLVEVLKGSGVNLHMEENATGKTLVVASYKYTN